MPRIQTRAVVRVLAAVAILAGTTGALLAQDAGARDARELAERLDELRGAAADRDVAEVQRLAQTFLAGGPAPDAADEARLLLGKTLLHAGSLEAATDAVDPAVERPESVWHVKSLYLVAAAAARGRAWQRAADIYAARVDWAASDAHAGEVAALYREIADAAYDGREVEDEYARKSRVRDWRNALRFYAMARGVHAGADGALLSYRIGESALESGDARGAVVELERLLAGEYGDAGEWRDDGLYALGRARLAIGDRDRAREAFADLREDFGDSEYAPLALIRIGETWGTSGAPDGEVLERIVAAWTEFLRLYPRHAEAPDVAWRVGDVQRAAGDLRAAAASYADFVTRFGDHEKAPEAQFAVAAAHLDLREFDEAAAQWRVLLQRWPDHALWPAAQDGVAKASFLKGSYAFDEKRDADAKAAFAAFLEAFPVDKRAPLAQSRLGDIEARAARHAEAVVAWRLAATKFPQSDSAPAAALRIAEAYEGPLADLDKALAAYEDVVRQWPQSSQAGTARGVLEQMKGKTLDASVKRPFRTDEKPAVAMRLRNVRSLRMKAYRLDAVEYVRRKGGLAGVENVDVDVVKPDHAWDWETPDYERYRLLERSCPLPFEKPGAYIVTAAEEEYTATLLVVVSDLTAIVKSSPSGGLVFVYDERQGTPVAGAEIHVLDGDLHGTTAEDGVWRHDEGGLPRLRAIVSGPGPHADHIAFADASSGAASAFGYTTKVFVHTDRPLYRGGQTVELRALVRRVHDGAYVTEPGLPVPVTVTDPRGAVLLDETIETDEYGTVSATLDLAADPALGTHTISARLDGRTFTRPFDVLAFRKPDILVDVRPEQQTYLVGDTVAVEAGLRYAVGGVASGVPVRWTIYQGPFAFDASVHEAYAWFFRDSARDEELRRREQAWTSVHARGESVTDVAGKLRIEFPTAATSDDFTYTVVVEAQDPSRRWVGSSAAVPVTRTGLHVISRTEKKVYRPGETMRLEVTTVNPLHVPVAVEGRAVLVRRRLVDQHWVEDETAAVDVATDAAGRAIVELAAPGPGLYHAKFVARDARGTPAVGKSPVTISGETEDLSKQVRLVADREFYREGDSAKVLVNVPSAPVPVLITYEGERVLEHRVFMATERSSTLELPLRAEHAPNVFLRMAVAKDGELQEDGDEVAVFQYLDVGVTAEPEDARPGDTVRLTVRTTDQSGKPVRASVSLDVVDATIFQLAPDGTPQIKPFFYDQRRRHSVATASSAGLTLPSVTRATNKDLLFEQMRRLGREQFEKMQALVERGRELLSRGEVQAAEKELEKALEIAPGNYEARKLREQIHALDKVADRKAGPAARRPAAPPPTGAADEPMENGVVGLGGGAGGAFGGRRGGRRNLRAGGGGKKSKDAGDDEDELQDAAVAPEFARQQLADFARARFRSLDTWAKSGDLRLAVLAAQAAAVFVPPELRERFEDTALSRARVRTSDAGEATLELELPDNLTEWRVTARGSSVGPLVGEGRTAFRTGKPLLVRADAPRFLVNGDTTTGTGTVHSSLAEAVDVTVRLTAQGAGLGGEREYTAQLGPGAVVPFDATLSADAPGLGRFRAEALSSVESDATVTAVPVLPFGTRRLSGASGVLEEEAYAELDLPEGAVAGSTSLVVTLSPSVDVSLLESAAYTSSYPWGCIEQTVNRFLPVLAARSALEKSGSVAFRAKERLDESVRRGLAALYSYQNDDGSFGWFGVRRQGTAERGGGGDPEMTAYAALGMVRAERAGYRVSTTNRDRALAAAQRLLPAANREDRAFLLYALSFAGKAGLEDVNALYRERSSLTPRGVALLSLVMRRTGREGQALELLGLLEQSAQREDGGAHWGSPSDDVKRRFVRVIRPDAEPTAYALLAFVGGEPGNLLVDEAAAWLLGTRRGPAWRSTRDTAAAIEALAEYARLRGVEAARGTVDVYLNGGEEPVVSTTFGGPRTDPVDAPVSLRIPESALVAGRNRLVLRRRGAGRVLWSALLAAVEGAPVDATLPAGGVAMKLSRDYTEWAPPALPGEVQRTRVAPGWSVVVPDKRPKDWFGRPLSRAGTGDKVRVTLRLSASVALQRVIVEDALPAGFEVVAGSAEGAFDREERRDDRQVFFVSRVGEDATLSYVLQAVHPGDYRALPATARAMYEPELHAWSRSHSLSVSPESGVAGRAPSAEEITPDELWGLALRDFDRSDWTAARGGLRGLIERFELRDEILEEAWARLFRIGLELEDAELTVKAYEELRARNPRRGPTDLRQRQRLARAYQQLGEHERALTLYRDLVRGHAALHRAAAEAYRSIGNPWRARDLRLEGLRRLPDVAWTEAEELDVARETLKTPIPLAAGTTSGAAPLMLTEGVEQLRAFQAHHPESALAHEAGHLAVRTLLTMDLSADAIEEGTRFLARYADSRYLDDVTYLVAEGQFQAGDYDRAVAAAAPLLEEEFPRDDDPSKKAVSPFRPRAVHLTAKVAHLRGDLAGAMGLYEQVAGEFPDAADALEFLRRKGLELREVETAAVGETPALHLRRRNVPEVSLKVYAVDFMILYALRRDLSAVNQIDLAGVRPVREFTHGGDAGGPEANLRWREESVPLPESAKGVYLVVARGGGLDASSVVLVSNLLVQVQQKDGRVRVYATNRQTGAPVGEVYVKIGDGQTIKAQGFTDARGVFEAGGVGGSFSVVAEKKGHVALWRR